MAVDLVSNVNGTASILCYRNPALPGGLQVPEKVIVLWVLDDFIWRHGGLLLGHDWLGEGYRERLRL